MQARILSIWRQFALKDNVEVDDKEAHLAVGPVDKDNVVLRVTSRLLLQEHIARPDVPDRM